MRREYIGYVEISDAIEVKIKTKHGLTPDEVREVCHDRHTQQRWHEHVEHGQRLLLKGRTASGRNLKVVLQEVDRTDGSWRLRTALVMRGADH